MNEQRKAGKHTGRERREKSKRVADKRTRRNLEEKGWEELQRRERIQHGVKSRKGEEIHKTAKGVRRYAD